MRETKKYDELTAEAASAGAPGEAAELPEHERIARRAYQIWEERGGGDGEEMNDWLRAEAEIREAVREPATDETGWRQASGASASR